MSRLRFILFLLVLSTGYVNSANLLGVFSSPGYSQFILGEKLMTELARRGHKVTVISPYKPREEVENYRTILTDGLIQGPQRDMFQRVSESYWSRIKGIHHLGYTLTEYTLGHPDVQELIHSNKSFDLVIAEQFANEALMGFGPHFKAPTILFSSIGLSEWNSHLMGNIKLPSVVPTSKTEYTESMTFFQRSVNALVNLGDILYKEFVAFPIHQEYLETYFPTKMDLKEVIYNASLMFLNSHFSIGQPTFLTTSVVEIGGFHISPKKLPEHIQKFLDDARDGAILFSMGTNLNLSNLSRDKLSSICKALSKLKQRVLWKMEEDAVSEKYENILMSKWLPQVDILGHSNVVAFVTHGGLLSTTEAVFHGVPMVGIPIFGDQRMNVARCLQKGIAVHLSFEDLTETSLFDAINQVIENPTYRQNVKKLSAIFHDRVVEPLDLAMYWVEYVIRHGWASHLKDPSLNLTWYQLYLVDVIGFAVLCALIVYQCFPNRRRQSGKEKYKRN
ncbi:hypothetical protein NQ318_011389 [Aromia moschata]|uniref:UDP-glucuronosyltransferase n=1 Tax=Aromia moschata TaxID=1265417 RepID=A0AAV8YSP4_9CUCU|nr:hypothetical protein NQ318_011389 [Aromia moschata]